jgi:hypothetical protein
MRSSAEQEARFHVFCGGVYILNTILVDAETVIAHNHASDSNDECFGRLIQGGKTSSLFDYWEDLPWHGANRP